MSHHTGQCMCGQVKYEVSGEPFGVVSCHCKGCQQLHGNYNPMLVADLNSFTLTQVDGIAWYDSSPENKRGFCKNCGSALFKRPNNGTKILISVGSLDDTTDLVNVRNIWVQEAGSYYVMPPGEQVRS